IEHTKFSIFSEPFDPVESINHTIRLFELTTLRKNILLDFKYDEVPHCIGDSLRLHQVILNLVANSIKFTPSGGYIKVELTAEIENSSANLNISVSDTGIGIPREKLNNIFDPFEQVDPSIPQNFGGTGLGLAVSWNIVNLMGGNLSVESELGKGSRFFFSLKLPLAQKKEEIVTESNFHNQTPDLKPMHALIAEDTPESRELLIKMLETMGITCDPASNGKEAYELFLKNKYDAVILDGYMPEMDGMTAARKMREHENHNSKKKTPIIALSARALSSERDEFLNAGADHFIVKPVSFESLSDGLSRFTQKENINQTDNNKDAFFAKLSAFLGIPETGVISVFEAFKRSTLPQYISEIKCAIDPLERDKLMRAAHRLRGSSASLLLEKLASACSLLEEFSKYGNPDEIKTHAENVFI
ncbi:MAG: response regulator, partial [Spirochaetes bacterium]|nr:response regulator [Spirochaetota bacterium]